MIKKMIRLFSVLIVAVAGAATFLSISGKAAINYNYLMDDYIFSNSSTLNAAQIDTFINSFPNSCISQNANGNGNPGFRTADPTGWSASEPNNHGYTFGGNVTAGQAIYDASRIYSVNPQVILATLQKEQSLVSGSAGCHYNASPSGQACPYAGGCVDIGMSYACPLGCNDSYKGFSLQLIAGSWLLRFAQQRSQGITTGYVGHDTGDENISYSGLRVGTPGGISDGNTITAQTGATASLYYYTPFENGNNSFVTIFQAWFGPTTGTGYSLVKSSDCPSACAQYVVYGTIKQHVPDSQTLQAWGLDTVTLLDMSPTALASYSSGPDLGRLAKLNTSRSDVAYFMDGGKRYKITNTLAYNVWNFANHDPTISNVSPGLFSLPSDGGDIPFTIKDPGSSTYYMVDGGNGSGQTVLRAFSSDSVRLAWDGSLSGYLPISSDYFSTINSAIGSAINTTKVVFGLTNIQVSGGQKLYQTNAARDLYPGTALNVSRATLDRLRDTNTFINYLVATPGDPYVYLIDGGTKHKITSSNTYQAWKAPAQSPPVLSNAFMSLISSGSDLSVYLATDEGGNTYIVNGNKKLVPSSLASAYSGVQTAYSASNNLLSFFDTDATQATYLIKGAGSPSVYLLNNSSQKELIEWPDKLTLIGGSRPTISVLPDDLISLAANGSNTQIYVTDGVTNYVLDDGQKWTVSGPTASAWGLSSPKTYSDGTLDNIPNATAGGGALSTKLRDDAGGYIMVLSNTAYGTVDPNIADVWGIIGTAAHTGALFRTLLPTTHYPLSPVVRSSTNSNVYIVTGSSTAYLLQNPGLQLANLRLYDFPSMSLNPSSLTVGGNWDTAVIKNSGNYYVIDDGVKRFLPAGQIRDQWTSFASTADPTASAGFLNFYASGSNMERTVKATGPSVYSINGEVKQHILYPDTYTRYYAPYTLVSDRLVNTLPQGADI